MRSSTCEASETVGWVLILGLKSTGKINLFAADEEWRETWAEKFSQTGVFYDVRKELSPGIKADGSARQPPEQADLPLMGLMGCREQCTYHPDPRFAQGIYMCIPTLEVSFSSTLFLCAHHTLWVMAAPSITNPFAIISTSKEVLLCFFGVYGFVSISFRGWR